MSNELQQLQSAAVNGEALHLGVRATETLWLEVSAMIKASEEKDRQLKALAVKLQSALAVIVEIQQNHKSSISLAVENE